MIETMAWKWGALLVGMVVTMAGLLVGHWFPWVNRLPRVKAYAYGTLMIWLGFLVWRGAIGDWETPAGLLGIIVMAGATVLAAYKRDETVRKLRQAEMAEAVDSDLSLPV